MNVPSNPTEDENGIENGYQRAMLNWYSIDPIFYSSQRPSEITDEDLSSLYTSRVFINELFPDLIAFSAALSSFFCENGLF